MAGMVRVQHRSFSWRRGIPGKATNHTAHKENSVMYLEWQPVVFGAARFSGLLAPEGI